MHSAHRPPFPHRQISTTCEGIENVSAISRMRFQTALSQDNLSLASQSLQGNLAPANCRRKTLFESREARASGIIPSAIGNFLGGKTEVQISKTETFSALTHKSHRQRKNLERRKKSDGQLSLKVNQTRAQIFPAQTRPSKARNLESSSISFPPVEPGPTRSNLRSDVNNSIHLLLNGGLKIPFPPVHFQA